LADQIPIIPSTCQREWDVPSTISEDQIPTIPSTCQRDQDVPSIALADQIPTILSTCQKEWDFLKHPTETVHNPSLPMILKEQHAPDPEVHKDHEQEVKWESQNLPTPSDSTRVIRSLLFNNPTNSTSLDGRNLSPNIKTLLEKLESLVRWTSVLLLSL